MTGPPTTPPTTQWFAGITGCLPDFRSSAAHARTEAHGSAVETGSTQGLSAASARRRWDRVDAGLSVDRPRDRPRRTSWAVAPTSGVELTPTVSINEARPSFLRFRSSGGRFRAPYPRRSAQAGARKHGETGDPVATAGYCAPSETGTPATGGGR